MLHDKDKVTTVVPPQESRPFPPCHPGRFPADTLVHTPEGPRPIEKIRAGHAVTAIAADEHILRRSGAVGLRDA